MFHECLSFLLEFQSINYIGLLKFAAIQSLAHTQILAGRQSSVSSFSSRERAAELKAPIQEIIPTYVLDLVPTAVNAKPLLALRCVFVPWKNC